MVGCELRNQGKQDFFFFFFFFGEMEKQKFEHPYYDIIYHNNVFSSIMPKTF